MRRLTSLTGCLAAALLLVPGPSAHALSLGFSSTFPITSSTSWMSRAVAEGADVVRVNVAWSAVAPQRRPRGFRPTNPGSPGYDWSSVDQQVRDLVAHGIEPLVSVTFAPSWAEPGPVPRQATPGTWRPDPGQYGAFALAAARRYSGTFPDPLRPGRGLPRVRLWQAWNEPNLSSYLAPQWTRTRGGYSPTSALVYRDLLNAFYAGVKQVSGANVVAAAGTAPYGDPAGGSRMQPVAFYRSVLCFANLAPLRPLRCRDPAHLDAVSTHPYGVGGPFWHAINPDDVAVPDVDKIASVLRAAQRSGGALPRTRKRIWVTETSWDSNPPDPQAIPVGQQARWLEQAFYVLWKQGVDTILWLQIKDDPCSPDCASTYQAGTYLIDGQPKPSATAFRFPFVVQRLHSSRLELWGRSPVGGILTIQVRRRGRWAPWHRLHVGPRQVFDTQVAEAGRILLRAVVGRFTSLSWAQG